MRDGPGGDAIDSEEERGDTTDTENQGVNNHSR